MELEEYRHIARSSLRRLVFCITVCPFQANLANQLDNLNSQQKPCLHICCSMLGLLCVQGFALRFAEPSQAKVLQLDNFEEFLPLEPPVRLDYKVLTSTSGCLMLRHHSHNSLASVLPALPQWHQVLDYPLHEVPPPSACPQS